MRTALQAADVDECCDGRWFTRLEEFMHYIRAVAWIVLTGTLVLTGCVSNRAQSTFNDVRADVVQRAGHRIEWNRDRADAEVSRGRSNALLADDLRIEQAVEIALLNNPRLQALYESIGLAEAEVVDAMLPPNPSFEAIYKSIHEGGHIWEFILVQEVVDLVMIPWRKDAREANAERVRARVTAGVLDVLLDVKVAYRRVQTAQQLLGMLRTVRKSDLAAYEMANRLRDAGNIPKLELRGRKAVLEQTKLAVRDAELNLAERREALTVLLGLQQPESDWRLAPLPEIPDRALDAKAIRTEALPNSLDLSMAGYELRRTLEQEGITDVTSLLPELHVGVESEREPDGTWIVGPMLEFPLPLFDWGQADRAGAEAAVRRAGAQYRAAQVEVASAVRLVADRLRITRDQAVRYRDILVPLQKDLMQETQLHFNAMQLGVFQLLAAKKEELQVRQAYVEALRNYWVARAEAEQLMNGRMVRASAVAGGAAPQGGTGGSGGNGH